MLMLYIQLTGRSPTSFSWSCVDSPITLCKGVLFLGDCGFTTCGTAGGKWMSSKVLFWDFDGTLGYRRGGKWSSALLEALHEIEPDCDVTLDDLKPLVSSGFPWHHPDVAHTHLHTPELWWSSLRKQVIEKAYSKRTRLDPCRHFQSCS